MLDPNSITNDQPDPVETINSDVSSKFELIKKLRIEAEGVIGQIQKILDTGFLPTLIEFAQKDDEPQFQLEAVSALRVIADGTSDQKQEIVDRGALPILVKLLSSQQPELVEKAIHAIGNISVQAQHGDLLLDHGALDSLIVLLEKALIKGDSLLIEEGIWALSNLCIRDPLPMYEKVCHAISILCAVIEAQGMPVETYENALQAINTFVDREDKIARVLEGNIIPSIMRLLDCREAKVLVPALMILGNILEQGSDDQANIVLKASSIRDFMKKLFYILKHAEAVRNEVCWMLSILTSRTSEDIDLIIDNPEHIEQLVKAALYGDDLEVKRNASLTLSIAIHDANPSQMISLSQSGALNCMCRIIQQDLSEEMTKFGLTGIGNFLVFGSSKSQKEATNNKCLIKLKQKGTIKRIKMLRKSFELATELSQQFFKEPFLRKSLKLKRAVVCFRNERYCLFGLFHDKKKRLSV